ELLRRHRRPNHLDYRVAQHPYGGGADLRLQHGRGRRHPVPLPPELPAYAVMSHMPDRWVTFDCYGTLIDWNAGLRLVLGRAFGEERADAQLRRYHELEPELQADGRRRYRAVLTDAMGRLGGRPDQASWLADSLPEWPAFVEVRAALEAARAAG